MESIDKDYICPVCGFLLDFKPWNGNTPSDEICDCCRIQFGYYDMFDKIEERKERYKYWRNKWIEEGMLWNKGRSVPLINWDPKKQLENLKLLEDNASSSDNKK